MMFAELTLRTPIFPCNGSTQWCLLVDAPVSTPKSCIVPSVYPTASVLPFGLQVKHESVRFPMSSRVSVKLRCQPMVLQKRHPGSQVA